MFSKPIGSNLIICQFREVFLLDKVHRGVEGGEAEEKMEEWGEEIE